MKIFASLLMLSVVATIKGNQNLHESKNGDPVLEQILEMRRELSLLTKSVADIKKHQSEESKRTVETRDKVVKIESRVKNIGSKSFRIFNKIQGIEPAVKRIEATVGRIGPIVARIEHPKLHNIERKLNHIKEEGGSGLAVRNLAGWEYQARGRPSKYADKKWMGNIPFSECVSRCEFKNYNERRKWKTLSWRPFDSSCTCYHKGSGNDYVRDHLQYKILE